jgi:hypothetical protein
VLKIATPLGIVYEGETDEQAAERDRLTALHNAEVERELQAWKPGPAKFYRKWCEKYAPHLLVNGRSVAGTYSGAPSQEGSLPGSGEAAR